MPFLSQHEADTIHERIRKSTPLNLNFQGPPGWFAVTLDAEDVAVLAGAGYGKNKRTGTLTYEVHDQSRAIVLSPSTASERDWAVARAQSPTFDTRRIAIEQVWRKSLQVLNEPIPGPMEAFSGPSRLGGAILAVVRREIGRRADE